MPSQPAAGPGLRAQRRAAGLTQRQLAAAAQVSVRALRDIERGCTAGSRGALSRLAAVLGRGERDRPGLASPPGEDRPAPGTWVGLLGPMRARRDGVPVPLGSAREQAVLALLVLNGTAGVSRGELTDLLWPDELPPTAPVMVAGYLSRTRQRLRPDRRRAPRPAGDIVVWDGAAYRLAPGAVRSDVEDLRALTARAATVMTAGQAAEAGRLYGQALRLWRGDPLEGLGLLRDHGAVTALARQRAALQQAYAATPYAAATGTATAGVHRQAAAPREARSPGKLRL
jgi:transcriptional regulator with XRE-family HTH domain